MVEKAQEEVDDIIREAGEQATFEVNAHNMHPDLVKIVGRLNYYVQLTVKMYLNIQLKLRILLVC